MALSGGWWSRAAARARGAGGLLKGDAWPWRARGRAARSSSGRGAPPPPPSVSELDKADAWLLRKAHETGEGEAGPKPGGGRGLARAERTQRGASHDPDSCPLVRCGGGQCSALLFR